MNQTSSIMPFKERFKILSKIGQGGMATVYLALDNQLKQEVALKQLSPTHLGNDTAVQRFRREFQSLHMLDHPNIVKSYELFEDGNTPMTISMEYVQGRPLSEIIESRTEHFDLAARVSILLQIAAALKAAHAAEIIHRDLKPANVLVTEDLTAKLADFGVAQLANQSVSLTKTGSSIGTPHYMSPEQIRNEGVDQRSDIYSFGVLAFEVLTHTRPYNEETILQISASHIAAKVPSIRERDPNLPRWLETMVKICLEKDPSERYQSMHEIVELLEHYLPRLEGKAVKGAGGKWSLRRLLRL